MNLGSDEKTHPSLPLEERGRDLAAVFNSLCVYKRRQITLRLSCSTGWVMFVEAGGSEPHLPSSP